MRYTGERFVPLNELMNDETAFEHFHRYYHALEFVEGKTVLDIACGEGYGSAILSKKAKKVYGVDIDYSCIDHATKAYQNNKLEFLQGNVAAIPLPDHCIDVIISFETIEHLDEKTQGSFLSEVKRVLKKNGRLIISTPDKKNYTERYAQVNEFHVKEFTKDEFNGFLGLFFKNIASLGQRYEIVDAITGEDISELSEAKVLNWERPLNPFSPKYLISICSDVPIEKEELTPSLVFQVSKDYWGLTDRMVEMEAHILELGAWGRRLDTEIQEKNNRLVTQAKDLEVLAENHEAQSSMLKKITGDLEDKNKLIASFGQSFQETAGKLVEMQARLLEETEWTRKFHNDLLQKDLLLHDNRRELERLYSEKQNWLSEEERLTKELRTSGEAKHKLETIIEELKNRVLDREGALSAIKKEVAEKSAFISQQSVAISSLKEKNDEHCGHIKMLELENDDKNKIIREQNQNVYSLTAQLDMINGRLAEIYESDGWKLLKRYYNIKGRLLPETSPRYRTLKKIVNTIRGKNDKSGRSELPKAIAEPQDIDQLDPVKSYEMIVFPEFEFPTVSIVIPAYNGWELTYKCLVSIKANTLGVSYEIVIGDDASTDETRNIKEYIKNITVIRNEKNLEFLHNCNRAATYARGSYILFLNNDIEVKAGWLSSMVDLAESDHTIGLVGSKLIYPNGKLQEAGAIIWNDGSGWNFGLNQDPNASEFNYVKEVDYVSGASIMIRAALWKEIGGFDTRYSPAYCEDSDLAFEVRKRGFKVVYQPMSEVIHFEGYTHGTDKASGIKGTEIKAYQKLNNEKFREKWKDVLEREHFTNGENVFWARDKSQRKKTILVIDHYVPHFDKDAGSRTVYQYLKLFVALDLNVKFIGDNYYRHEPYTTALQQMGVEVLYGPHYAYNWQDWIKDHHDKFDFVLLNRPHISIKYIDFIKGNTSAKILYYGHDLHFVRLLRQYEIENKKELLEEADKWKEVELSLFDKADLVLTPSLDEKNQIKSLGIKSNVQAIKPYIFETISEPITDFADRRDILFIGGFTHLPNIDAVLWFTREIWPLIKGAIPNVKFIIAGSNTTNEINRLAGPDIEVRGTISDEALRTLYSKIKMVVVPLRYGAGVKGKTVEAMYHGIPVVATQSGIEGLPGEHSFLVAQNSAPNFANEVIRLYNAANEELVTLSKMEVKYIDDHFQFENVKSEMLFLLNALTVTRRSKAELIN